MAKNTEAKNPKGLDHGPESEPQQSDSPILPETASDENSNPVQSLPDLESGATLFERISWVRKHLPKIEKDKTIGDGSFSYDVVTHENINQFLRPLMAKAGLIDYIDEQTTEVVDTGMKQGRAEKAVLHVRMGVTYTVQDMGGERISIKVTGWGEDAGDKGPGKAQTYALKAGRKIMFSISAGDAEEDRIDSTTLSSPQTKTVSPEQLSALLELSDELFLDDGPTVLKAMCDKVLNVPEPRMILEQHFETSMNLLRNKHKRDFPAQYETVEDDDSEIS